MLSFTLCLLFSFFQSTIHESTMPQYGGCQSSSTIWSPMTGVSRGHIATLSFRIALPDLAMMCRRLRRERWEIEA